MKSNTQKSFPDLQSVSLAFEQWRSSGASKRRTPDHLQQQSASLVAHHSKSEICRSLKIPYGTLNRWIGRFGSEHGRVTVSGDSSPSPCASGFVPLPTDAFSQAVSAEVESDPQPAPVQITLSNGTRLCAELSIAQLLHIIHSPGSVCVEQGGR